MISQNPTLLVGLGAFGRAVVELAAARPASAGRAPRKLDEQPDEHSGEHLGEQPGEPESWPVRDTPARVSSHIDAVPWPGIEIIVAGPGADHDTDDHGPDHGPIDAEAVAGEAEERCQRLLDLGHFVGTTAPADPRGPRLDVLVIGDLGNADVATAAPVVVELVARRLRSRFRPILRAGEGALAVCPLLLLPRDAAPAPMAAALRALAAQSRHPDLAQRLQARIYLVEDQSGKYLLSPGELIRSFAAFLHLILFSRLRDEHGVRSLVEAPNDDRSGPFATFVCATIEVDMAAAHELCALKLAQDILACYDAGTIPLAELAAEAAPLIPAQTTVEARLWHEGEDRTLESYLTPPDVPVPVIGWTDAPEDITEAKLGALWRLDTSRAIDGFRDRVERLQMDRLAAQIERNGADLMAEILASTTARMRAEAGTGPRGPGRALELARYAAQTASGLSDAARAHIEAPELRRYPSSPLDQRLAAVHEAASAWPRREPGRMLLFGGLAAVIGTWMIGGLVHMSAALIDRPLPWWASGAVALAVVVSATRYALWRHVKQHHNWVSQARDGLDQALERHLHRDVVDYFRGRLSYTRLLWVYRLYQRLAERLTALAAQLEAGRSAVAEARRLLASREHEARARLGESTAGSMSRDARASRMAGPVPGADSVLYRRLLQPDVVEALYRHARPADVSAVAARFHAEVTAAAAPASASNATDPFEAPFADVDRILAFCRRELGHLRALAPYEAEPMAGAVAHSVREHVQRLALKLSPPLELVQSAAHDVMAPSRVVIAPPEARALVEDALATLDQSWTVRSHSSDPARIHLLIERGGLPVEAVAVASTAQAAQRSAIATAEDQP